MPRPIPRRPPATRHQLDILRTELHHTVDTILDAWPTIDHQAALAASGFPPATLGTGITASAGNTLVETAVLRRQSKESDWLNHLQEFISHARTLHDELNILRAASDAELKTMRDNNTAELCAECGQPIKARTKRLDGQPYHHPDDQAAETDEERAGSCWWKAYNRSRGQR